MLNQPPDAGNRAALQSILQDYTNDTHPTTWNPNLHRGGRRGAGEDLEAAGAEPGGRGREGRPGCAERAACEDVDEVRGGGGRYNVVGRRGQPGCAKRAAREDDEARGSGGRGGVVWGRWGQPGGRDGGG